MTNAVCDLCGNAGPDWQMQVGEMAIPTLPGLTELSDDDWALCSNCRESVTTADPAAMKKTMQDAVTNNGGAGWDPDLQDAFKTSVYNKIAALFKEFTENDATLTRSAPRQV